MKQYLTRLWRAILNKNFYGHYHKDYNYPLVWELDEYIMNLIIVNLPRYNSGYPANIEEIEWDLIKEEMIELATKLKNDYGDYCTGKGDDFKYDIKLHQKDMKRFTKLLAKHFYSLRD